MAVNQSVYPDKYKFWSDQDKTYELFTVGDTFYTEQYKKLPFGQLWDNSNVYTTFDPTNTNLWFGVDSSRVTFETKNDNLGRDENPITYISGSKIFSEPRQVNLRMAFVPSTTSNSQSYGSLIYNWTKINEGMITSDNGEQFNNPYGLIGLDNSQYTRINATDKNVNSRLLTNSFMFVNDIKRENVFLGLALGFSFINDNGTDVSSSHSSVMYLKLGDNDFNKFLPGGENFDKRTFIYSGKLARIKTIAVFLYAREKEHNEDESFTIYYRNYRTDTNGENMNATSGDYYVSGWKMRIISELKIGDNIYYMNVDDFENDYCYNLYFYRNNYRYTSLFYGDERLGYAYSQSIKYAIYNGKDKDDFNVSTIFYPLSSTFEYDLSDNTQYNSGDILNFTNSGDLDRLETVNRAFIDQETNQVKFLKLQKPFITVKDIFHLLSSFLIPFTIINGEYSAYNTLSNRISKKETPNAYVGIRKEDGHVDGTWIPYEWGKTDVEHDFRPEEYASDSSFHA